jgi:hypothetical protein
VHAADPVVSDDKVFIASAYNKGSALVDISKSKPQTVWTSSRFNTHFSSFVFIDGILYGNDGDARRSTSGAFAAMDFDSGKVLWSEGTGFGSLIAVGDYLITVDFKGTVSILERNPRTYVVVSSGSLPRGQFWTPPAFAGGYLYCRDTRGNLYRIDMR